MNTKELDLISEGSVSKQNRKVVQQIAFYTTRGPSTACYIIWDYYYMDYSTIHSYMLSGRYRAI